MERGLEEGKDFTKVGVVVVDVRFEFVVEGLWLE